MTTPGIFDCRNFALLLSVSSCSACQMYACRIFIYTYCNRRYNSENKNQINAKRNNIRLHLLVFIYIDFAEKTKKLPVIVIKLNAFILNDGIAVRCYHPSYQWAHPFQFSPPPFHLQMKFIFPFFNWNLTHYFLILLYIVLIIYSVVAIWTYRIASRPIKWNKKN